MWDMWFEAGINRDNEFFKYFLYNKFMSVNSYLQFIFTADFLIIICQIAAFL
jgi:hypothetical protein